MQHERRRAAHMQRVVAGTGTSWQEHAWEITCLWFVSVVRWGLTNTGPSCKWVGKHWLINVGAPRNEVKRKEY